MIAGALNSSPAAPVPGHVNGEIAGMGPDWACQSYGSAGHDYFTCPACLDNYVRWLFGVRHE